MNDKQQADFKFVKKLVKQCHVEMQHTKHVTLLALKLFDDLSSLHKFGQREKYYLLCAAYMHDIGVNTEGRKGHHKTALRIILDTPILQCNNKDRLIIGSIARYHRKALPSKRHDHFAALKTEERKMVSILAGMLRITDGLDYRHKQHVKDVVATYTKRSIDITCLTANHSIKKEIASAQKKSGLLTIMFLRDINFHTRLEK